jgi:hypothetical protein
LLDSVKKDKYLKESIHGFYDEYFLRKLDSYKELMGFKNGVYDFKN